MLRRQVDRMGKSLRPAVGKVRLAIRDGYEMFQNL